MSDVLNNWRQGGVVWAALSKHEARLIWDSMSGAEKDVLMQLRQVRWDGFIASKTGRDALVSAGLATRYEGYTAITAHGVILLESLGLLESLTRGEMTLSGK